MKITMWMVLGVAACGAHVPSSGSIDSGGDSGSGASDAAVMGDGAIADGPTMLQDTWSPLAQSSTPAAYAGFGAVWSGTQMLTWGGYTGGLQGAAHGKSAVNIYDPATVAWTTGTDSAPFGVYQTPAVLWTGTTMIVYGQVQGKNGGDIYDPVTKTWKVISIVGQPETRNLLAGAWTGTKMIVWGGQKTNGPTEWNDGGIYDPATDTWSAMPQTGAIPAARAGHSAVWTGTRMIVWGGGHAADFSVPDHFKNDGASYDPATGVWTAISNVDAPTPRFAHTAVWTGSKMIVWGGKEQNMGSRYVNDGAAYDPATDTWTPISTTNAPEARWGQVAVWSNIGMIVWGGQATGGHPTDLYLYH